MSNFKYKYIVENYWGIRLLNLYACIAFICAIIGFIQFMNLSVWYAVIFGPLFAIVVFSKLSTFIVNVFYPHFDLDKHKKFIKDFWDENTNEPSVDVFLPVAGEPIEILDTTWKGVNNLIYKNINVYVLDDSHSKVVQELAEYYNFNYLARPNVGENKKSGNLKYGYEHSKGDYVFLLDADFVPIPEALIESIPYIVKNKNISILQTPQYFDTGLEIAKNEPIQYGAGSSVEDFYRVVMPSRGRFGNAMCVGTSAIYKREAISVSGVALASHTEDVRQGLITYKHGYHVSYLPVIISKGVCPSTIEGYTKQQVRWAFGSFETALSSNFKDAKFDIWGKLNYGSSFLYYLSESVAPLLSLQLLFLLYFHNESLKLSWAIPFIPFIVYQLFLKPAFTINKNKFGLQIVGLAHTYIYSTALVRFLLGKNLEWEATNTSNKSSKKSSIYLFVRNYSLIYTAAFTLITVFIFATKSYILLNFETYIVVIFCLYRIKNNVQFVWYNFKNLEESKNNQLIHVEDSSLSSDRKKIPVSFGL